MLKASITMLTLLSFAFAAVGCGVKEGMTKSELAKRADELCAKANPKAKALGEPDLDNLRSSERYFTRLYDISLDLRTDLRDLLPAKNVEDEWDAVLDKLDKTHNDIGHYISAAKNSDETTASDVAETLQGHIRASEQAWDDFGSPRCGSQS